MNILTIDNAHMPFLFQENGEMKILFGKNVGVQDGDIDWAKNFVFFREPWLSDPKYDNHREKVKNSYTRGAATLWKTFLIDKDLKGEAVRAPGFESPEKTVECSPFMLKGQPHCIWTPETRPVDILKDSWALSPYGWCTRHFSIWNTARSELTFGIRIGRGSPIFYTLVGLPEKTYIYRIVPVADKPREALITVAKASSPGRTFKIDLTAPKLTELRVDGEPVYKSSICGQYCAYAVKHLGREREVVVSDSYDVIIPVDVTLASTGETTQAVGSDPSVAAVIETFFKLDAPCDYSWCSALRAAYQKEVTDAGGPDCKRCRLSSIRRKYVLKVQESLHPPVVVESSSK